jgi:hypothetical protein
MPHTKCSLYTIRFSRAPGTCERACPAGHRRGPARRRRQDVRRSSFGRHEAGTSQRFLRPSVQCGSPELAHLRSYRRQPHRLLAKGTPAAGVTLPIIDSCDNRPHIGDRQLARPDASVMPFVRRAAGRRNLSERPSSRPLPRPRKAARSRSGRAQRSSLLAGLTARAAPRGVSLSAPDAGGAGCSIYPLRNSPHAIVSLDLANPTAHPVASGQGLRPRGGVPAFRALRTLPRRVIQGDPPSRPSPFR